MSSLGRSAPKTVPFGTLEPVARSLHRSAKAWDNLRFGRRILLGQLVVGLALADGVPQSRNVGDFLEMVTLSRAISNCLVAAMGQAKWSA